MIDVWFPVSSRPKREPKREPRRDRPARPPRQVRIPGDGQARAPRRREGWAPRPRGALRRRQAQPSSGRARPAGNAPSRRGGARRGRSTRIVLLPLSRPSSRKWRRAGANDRPRRRSASTNGCGMRDSRAAGSRRSTSPCPGMSASTATRSRRRAGSSVPATFSPWRSAAVSRVLRVVGIAERRGSFDEARRLYEEHGPPTRLTQRIRSMTF